MTVTDANLFLRRLLPEYFPKVFGPKENESLNTEISSERFLELTKEIIAEQQRTATSPFTPLRKWLSAF